MLTDVWNSELFSERLNGLNENCLNSNVSYSIGLVTQMGKNHIIENISNQDGSFIITNENYIIAVISDGCTSAVEGITDNYSFNQVGASIISQITANEIERIITSNLPLLFGEVFLEKLSNGVLQKIAKIIKLLSGEGLSKKITASNFFTTTILGVVLSGNKFIIFNSGDGIVSINGTIRKLDASGEYLINALSINELGNMNSQIQENVFHLIETGSLNKLDNCFLATDGFDNNLLFKSPLFHNFINKVTEEEKGGFVHILPELRLSVLDPFFIDHHNESNWPHDDATLLVIRKTNQIVNEIKSPDENPGLNYFEEDLDFYSEILFAY